MHTYGVFDVLLIILLPLKGFNRDLMMEFDCYRDLMMEFDCFIFT